MMYFLLGAIWIAFLVHDWFYDKLNAARWRIKAVYAALLVLSVYHLLVYSGKLRSYSYLDTATFIFGGVVKALLSYLNPKG